MITNLSDMTASAAKPAAAVSGARMRTLLIPREHGAWGLLLIPLVTGGFAGLSVAQNWLPLALLTIASLALFWMRAPAEIALGTSPIRSQSASETNWLLLATTLLASIAMLCIAALLWDGANRGLLALGALAAVAFVVQALLKTLGRRARMPAQLIGAIGLAAVAPAAWYIITGRLDSRALGLWTANWMFAGNQIHFVQLRIHAARAAAWREKVRLGRAFFLGQLLMIAALLAVVRAQLLPALGLAAFVPLLARGFLWLKPGAQPLAVRRLGWSELAQGIAFGLLLIGAYHV